jgi:hypothetical protein
LFQSYDDKGPVVDAVVWHDGEVWRAALDTQSLEDDPDCGLLANFVPLTNYRYTLFLVLILFLRISILFIAFVLRCLVKSIDTY